MVFIGTLNEGKIEEIRTGIADSPSVEGVFKDIIAGDQS